MKKSLSILAMAVAVLFSIASCNKEQTIANPDNTPVGYNERAVDPNSLINSMRNTYGLLFEFDSVKIVQNSGTSPFIRIATVPSYFFSGHYLTILFTPNNTVIGLFQVHILDYSAEWEIYDYEVLDPDDVTEWYFYGKVLDNNGNYNWLRVTSSLNVPSTYPYPIFDNLTDGIVGLEEFEETNEFISQSNQVVLKIAATIYANYCGTY